MHGEKAVLTQMDESDRIEAKLVVDGKQTKRISDKLIGIFFEDISRAADGGLCAELLQNGDLNTTRMIETIRGMQRQLGREWTCLLFP